MKLKDNKIFKISTLIVKILMGIVIAAFIVVVCMQRFSNNEMSFFNYRMFTVVSQSMTPKYDIGDVLISKEVEPSKIKEGDVISYLGASGDFANKVITHRVVAIEKSEDGKLYFRAKGDANIIEDPIVSQDQLYGVVVYKSFILSLVYRIVGTKIGFFLCIILPILFIICSEMLSTMLEKEEERRKKEKNKEN